MATAEIRIIEPEHYRTSDEPTDAELWEIVRQQRAEIDSLKSLLYEEQAPPRQVHLSFPAPSVPRLAILLVLAFGIVVLANMLIV